MIWSLALVLLFGSQHRPREPHLRVRRARGDAVLRQRRWLDRAGGVRADPAGRGAGVQGGGVHGAVGRPAVPREQGTVLLLLPLLQTAMFGLTTSVPMFCWF